MGKRTEGKTEGKSITMRHQTDSNASNSVAKASKRLLPSKSGKTEGKSLTVRHQTDSNASTSVAKVSKRLFPSKLPEEVPAKRQKTSKEDTDGEVNLIPITVEDLTNPEPSENYWRTLAKRRGVALEKASKENENLKKKIETLINELSKCKELLDEANCFVEIIQEGLGCSNRDDTGIEVSDVSTADENDETKMT